MCEKLSLVKRVWTGMKHDQQDQYMDVSSARQDEMSASTSQRTVHVVHTGGLTGKCIHSNGRTYSQGLHAYQVNTQLS